MSHYKRLIVKTEEELSGLEEFADKHRAIYADRYVYMGLMIRIDEVKNELAWLIERK